MMNKIDTIVRDFKESKWVVLSFAVGLAAFLMLVRAVFSFVTVNLTDSVPGTVFMQMPEQEITRNAFVLIPAKGGVAGPNIKHFTKMALCMPGDELGRVGRQFYCNGELITVAKPTSKAGEPLVPFQWESGVIPEGFFFAGSSHPDGYDSRYFGLVNLNESVVVEKVL